MAGFSSRTRRNELRVIDAIIANPGWVPKLQCDAAPAAAFKATTRYKVLLSQLERAEAAGSDSSAQLSVRQQSMPVLLSQARRLFPSLNRQVSTQRRPANSTVPRAHWLIMHSRHLTRCSIPRKDACPTARCSQSGSLYGHVTSGTRALSTVAS